MSRGQKYNKDKERNAKESNKKDLIENVFTVEDIGITFAECKKHGKKAEKSEKTEKSLKGKEDD